MTLPARTAVITGASSGIGRSLARRLTTSGWRVLLIARGANRLRHVSGEMDGSVVLALDIPKFETRPDVRQVCCGPIDFTYVTTN